MPTFSPYAVDSRPVDALSRAQIALILGLDHVLQQAGWVLTCPTCAREGFPSLQTNNAPEDTTWKIDCQCRRRRVNRGDVTPMPTSGDLLLLVPDLLSTLSLDVRCPSLTCLQRPLKVHQTKDGLLVTCQCGTYKFSKTQPPTTTH